MNEDELKRAAWLLAEAEKNRQPIEPLTEQFSVVSVADAYRIQAEFIGDKLASGEQLVGRKVGLTSQAMQKLLGVDAPDFGCLTDRMRIENGGALSVSKLIQPKIEAEIAFVIGENIGGKNVSESDLKRAVRGIVPSLEIIDSRIVNWNIKLADTVADNGSSAYFVVGDEEVPLNKIDLPSIEMRLTKNDSIVQTGAGAAVLGNPLNAVLWLVRSLAEFNEGLRAGDIVLPGALAAAVNAEAGDSFSADFDALGAISVSFV